MNFILGKTSGIGLPFFVIWMSAMNRLSLALIGNAMQSPSIPALINLKAEILKSNPGALPSWNSSGNPCDNTWEGGIKCDPSTKAVLELIFSSPRIRLKGPIPGPQLANLTSLQILDLSRNDFSGPIPAALFSLVNLTELDLGYCLLNGTIPSAIGNARNLHVISFPQNTLEGIIPASIGNLTSLVTLDLSNNDLVGPIPHSFTHLSKLQKLQLFNNGITGPIPEFFGQYLQLSVLDLANNNLSGALTPNIGAMKSLQLLNLARNEFTGLVPESLGSIPQLQLLFLSENLFSGAIPEALGSLSSLLAIQLDNNPNITGEIPHSFAGLKSLIRISLQYMSLTGPIPPFLGNLSRLTDIWLGGNQLTGPIPSSLSSLTKLERLYLNLNQLNGSIPGDLCDLDAIVDIDLSFNMLSGQIPYCLTGLQSLQSLDVESNLLTGEVPPLLNGSSLTFKYDNNCLPGVPSQLACSSTASHPETNPNSLSSTDSGFVAALTVVFFLVVLVVVLIVVWGNCLENSNQRLREMRVREFSIHKVKVATDNFATVVGRDNFGATYLAHNLLHGRAAIVKRSKDPSRWGEMVFLDRVRQLQRMRHPFNVNLLGCCLTQSEHILVFEDVHGLPTLHQCLHDPEQPLLTWESRVKIAVNLALVLEHFHRGVSPAVIHGDVNSSKVFVTPAGTAKLSEFLLSAREDSSEGLRKLPSSNARRQRKARSGSSASGSAAFEEASEKQDVYCFGVVLLELLTGQPVMKDVHISSLTAPFLEDPQIMILMVDSRLEGSVNQPELQLLGSIAKQCVQEGREERPGMSEVLDRLQKGLHMSLDYFEVTGEPELERAAQPIAGKRSGRDVVEDVKAWLTHSGWVRFESVPERGDSAERDTELSSLIRSGSRSSAPV